METASIPTESPNAESAAETSPAEVRDRVTLLKFSDEVHVGEGAEECEKKSNGSCENPEHFHAFIRLPNQFQRESLAEKADAARARRLRQLRDPESDISSILDVELEEKRRQSDHAELIEEVVTFDFLKDHMAAMREVAEDEDFEHIEDDRERLRALSLMEEEDRPADEFKELQDHVLAYQEKVNEARERIQQPLRDSLNDKGVDDLLDIIRAERVTAICNEAAERAWSRWEWFIGTLKSRVPKKLNAPQERVFENIDALNSAAPEVIDALERAYRDIEAAAGRSVQGTTA
jgi:hypothetical protein